jgi:hypothetical protein
MLLLQNPKTPHQTQFSKKSLQKNCNSPLAICHVDGTTSDMENPGALYVEGLKANLLSINQLCDDDLVVQFSKKECNIFDNNGKWLMGGERTSDNCYGIPNLSSDSQIICNKATIDESELWHQRLGYLNFTNVFKIASKEVVKDLPKMKDTGKTKSYCS